jgi:hypothetical protein
MSTTASSAPPHLRHDLRRFLALGTTTEVVLVGGLPAVLRCWHWRGQHPVDQHAPILDRLYRVTARTAPAPVVAVRTHQTMPISEYPHRDQRTVNQDTALLDRCPVRPVALLPVLD